MKQELTIIQEAIMKAIKQHNNNERLIKFNKCIRFESMGRYIHKGYEEYVITGYKDKSGKENISLTRYEVKCSFKPEKKYDDNIVKYEVIIYSDGTIGVLYDGTSFRLKL